MEDRLSVWEGQLYFVNKSDYITMLTFEFNQKLGDQWLFIAIRRKYPARASEIMEDLSALTLRCLSARDP